MILHHLNLLPPEDVRRLGHEKLTRFLILVFGVLAAILLTGGILMLPTYFLLTFQEEDVLRQIDIAQKSIATRRTNEAENTIRAINAKLITLDAANVQRSLASSLMAAVAKDTGSGISLDRFSFSRDSRKIELTGEAPTRELFLNFLNRLHGDTHFASVESPVANLLKDTDLSFILTLIIAEQ